MPSTRRDFLFASTALAGVARAQAPSAALPVDIFHAAADGDVPGATRLLNADAALVRARAADGRTPLHYATAAGKPAMVQFLVLRGAELNAGAESPLIAAVDFPDHAIAAAMSIPMVVNSADPNCRDRAGRTALELATARGHQDIATLLIHRGATATAAQTAGIERAHYARRYSQDRTGKPVSRDDLNGLPWLDVNTFVSLAHVNFEKVKELLTAEPRLLSTRSSWDELAIEAAAHTGHLEMSAWLAERGAPVSTCTAILLGEENLVKTALAEDPACVRERGAHDIALISFTAFAQERTTLADRLLQAGANVNARSPKAQTALHVAASKGYIGLAALLIQYGADLNLAANMGNEMLTPLDVAIRSKQAKVEQLLRDHGARSN